MKSAPQFQSAAIDHLGVVGRDIAIMIDAYVRLGFSPTEPVPLMGMIDEQPTPLGQDSAHLIFADSYVELSGVTSTDPAHHLAPWLKRRKGLHILALGSDDAVASHSALESHGLDVPAVQDAGRHVTYGTHHGDAAFKWFKAPDALGDEGFVCLVEQITPELVFQPPENGHPNGALGVTGVTILSDSPAESLKRFEAYPGVTGRTPHSLSFSHQTLSFLNPNELADQFGIFDGMTSPAFAGFTMRVEDLETTRAVIKETGVTVHDHENGDLWVNPTDACGTLLIFSAK
jgi:hypothetical protein